MTSSSLAAVAHDAVGPPIPFDNSYARLPEAFYERVRPLRVAAPQLLRLNEALAQKLRIDPEFLKSSQGVEILRWQRHRTGFGANRACLCGAPIRAFRAATRRRTRRLAW